MTQEEFFYVNLHVVYIFKQELEARGFAFPEPLQSSFFLSCLRTALSGRARGAMTQFPLLSSHLPFHPSSPPCQERGPCQDRFQAWVLTTSLHQSLPVLESPSLHPPKALLNPASSSVPALACMFPPRLTFSVSFLSPFLEKYFSKMPHCPALQPLVSRPINNHSSFT